MKRAQLVPKGSLDRILQAAEAAWQNGDPQQAIEQLERASRLAPANCQVLLRLGQIHGLSYDYTSAERSFEKAVRVAPVKTEMLAAVASHTTDFADHKFTELYFQKAIERGDARPEILVRFAEFYEHMNREADASRLVERALQLNAGCPLALLARARLERQAGRFEEAERLLRSIPTTADPETKTRGYYELGTILDGQKRYDEAMAAFLEAKAMLRSQAAPHIPLLHDLRARIAKAMSLLTAEQFQRWFAAAGAVQPPRPVALLCGHPRSGTTLLEQVLDSHPNIVSIEETRMFVTYAYNRLARRLTGRPLMPEVLESASAEALQESRKSYFAAAGLHLGSPVGNRLLIDKNPTFNLFIPAFARIFPEVKFLVALRDPRDVCLSCFMQPITALTHLSAAYLSVESTVEEYAATMETWRAYKPLVQDHGLEVRYEAMVDNLESVALGTLDFLGMNWDDRVLQFNAHVQNKRVRSPTYADVAKPVSRKAMGRWRNYQKYLEPHLARLEPFVKAFGYSDS